MDADQDKVTVRVITEPETLEILPGSLVTYDEDNQRLTIYHEDGIQAITGVTAAGFAKLCAKPGMVPLPGSDGR